MGFKRIAYARRVVVNLDDRTSIDGVLMREPRGLLVLVNAQYHEPGVDLPTPLDGEVVIPRERILFVQAP